MTVQNSRMVFINLPVRDLERTKAFFTALGFTYNPQFTDANAACMVLSDQALVMLLAEPFFKGFTKRQICDTSTHTEVLVAVSCTSRDDVDEMVRKAIAAGGAPAMPPVDHGFMYGSSFYDVDGHHWEVTWMDPKAIE